MKLKFTKEQLEEIIKDVFSTAEVCRRLNIRPVGVIIKQLKSI